LSENLEKDISNKLPPERIQFKKLLLQNPNYFGNIKECSFKAVKSISQDTQYEELTCIGFNQNFNTIEATIALKRSTGYNGDLCSSGSIEYVRFFIDYGTGWIDAGESSVNVHDIPNSEDCYNQNDKPLTYVISLNIDPKTNYCKIPVIPKVRAILSWNYSPPEGDENADWSPIWGNAKECYIQIKPRQSLWRDIMNELEPQLVKGVKIPLEYKQIDVGPLPILPPQLSVTELAKEYDKANPHRFGLSDIHAILNTDVLDQNLLESKVNEWKALGLDLPKTIEVLEKTNANVEYEQLECLGLDYYQENVVATLRIKRPNGYSGDLCKKGSLEYVSFWEDFDNKCEWKFLGIKSVNVHDFGKSFPEEGICHSVVVPVNLSQYRRGCEEPKIGRVRAVLSWNVSPSSTDPDKLDYWGNRLDAHVQIRPGEVVLPESPPRFVLGGIHVNDIDDITGMTVPDAKFSSSDTYADSKPAPRRPCPFGGQVNIKALDYGINYVGRWYKIERRNITASSTWIPLNAAFRVQDWNGNWHFMPQSGDYFQIPQYSFNPHSFIQRWYTTGDDLWEIRVTIRTGPSDTDPLVLMTSHPIQLDNTAPVLPETDPPSNWNTLRDRINIFIDSGGDCKKFDAGVTINGHFVAQDLHFGSFSISVLPKIVDGILSNPVIPNPATQYEPTSDPPGSQWTLDTNSPRNMKPCGYVVRLVVWDRSIVNSGSHHNRNEKSVGFCLE